MGGKARRRALLFTVPCGTERVQGTAVRFAVDRAADAERQRKIQIGPLDGISRVEKRSFRGR